VERRQAILDAALDEFAARGFAATRLDDVARKAGVAKGTIYTRRRTPFDHRLSANETATIAQRTPDELRTTAPIDFTPTRAGPSEKHMPVHAHGSLWTSAGVRRGPKNSLRAGRVAPFSTSAASPKKSPGSSVLTELA
jgi:Bacterial regulatory proteins, tetR family